MASKNKGSKGPSESLLQQFCSVTGASKQIGISMLTACDNNLELAVSMQLDGGSSGNTAQPSTSSAFEAPVRAPIPQYEEKLVEDTPRYGFRGRRRAATTRSVFDGFRDFEAEMRHQESIRWEGGATASANSRKRKTLEELFRPPIDLIHKGSFNTAKTAGATSKKWLLVNIQNSKEFPCQVLNRDIWSNPAVKAIVNEHFVFWQVYHDSEEGRQYMQFYNVQDWPYVAVIDPITGENMVVWNKLDCNTFCELVTGFLSVHPSLDGTSSPPSKKSRSDDNIINATEDSQLQEALKKSMEETKARVEPILPDLTDDESADDLETFTDSDSDNPSTPVKKSNATICHEDRSTAKYKKESGDNSIEKQSQVLNSESSGCTAKNGKNSPPRRKMCEEQNDSAAQEKQSTWKCYLGNAEDPESRLQIKFPDGKREQLNIPCSSKLKALIQYVIEAGFSNERYELVTNYPKRKLSYLDFDQTVKSIGLFPQETIFVQER